MKRMHFAKLGLALLSVVPVVSHAVLAYAAKEVNLRAGPARESPVVATIWQGPPCRWKAAWETTVGATW